MSNFIYRYFVPNLNILKYDNVFRRSVLRFKVPV